MTVKPVEKTQKEFVDDLRKMYQKGYLHALENMKKAFKNAESIDTVVTPDGELGKTFWFAEKIIEYIESMEKDFNEWVKDGC